MGGQIAPMDIVARDLRVRHRLLTLAANWFAHGVPDGLFPEDERRFGIHAGDMETSVMLALHGELVQMEHARDFRPAIADIDRDYSHVGLSPAGKLGCDGTGHERRRCLRQRGGRHGGQGTGG